MKLWQKENYTPTLEIIERFTVGKDQEMDLFLAPFDILGNIAHAQMLGKIGLLTDEEAQKLTDACRKIFYDKIEKGAFYIFDGVEDVHSQVEFELIEMLGDVGKKIHAGRSRNDQVLVDLKMFFRAQIEVIFKEISSLFDILIHKSERYKDHLLPGYTHLQIAMPSSFGLWFGAYAESLVDDLQMLQAVFKIVNKNPLGSGAGYGSSFSLDRKMTTELLAFEDLNYNVVYAQMTRGKTEFVLSQVIGTVCHTLSKLAMDVCLYNSQNFGFITLPDEITTGSSIMPHKKNPDVAELLRGKTNKLKGLSIEIAFVQSNLPSGYHREFQILKELIFPAFQELKECLQITSFVVEKMSIKENILDDPKYDLLFSVENVNSLVAEGYSFRDAYREVGKAINDNSFSPVRKLNHSLIGSVGNPANAEIKTMMQKVQSEFDFAKIHAAYNCLLGV